MTWIDRQGRVFGRLNVVDAGILLIIGLAIPAAYAAHRLFRDPPATLVRIAPVAVEYSTTRLVEITGEHFRPYLRVSFGDQQAASFQFYGPTQAFVPVPALEPGVYDVVLHDYMREVSRLPQALTVTGPITPPPISLRIDGAYVGLTAAAAAALQIGQPMNATDGLYAHIETTGDPRPAVARVRVSDAVTVPVPMADLLELPATLVLTCPTSVGPGGVLRCATGGVTLAPDMHLSFESPAGRLLFRVDRVGALAAVGDVPVP